MEWEVEMENLWDENKVYFGGLEGPASRENKMKEGIGKGQKKNKIKWLLCTETL